MDSNLRSPTDPLPYPSNQLAPDDGWPIAVFEVAGMAVALQRGTKAVGPDRHPEFR